MRLFFLKINFIESLTSIYVCVTLRLVSKDKMKNSCFCIDAPL